MGGSTIQQRRGPELCKNRENQLNTEPNMSTHGCIYSLFAFDYGNDLTRLTKYSGGKKATGRKDLFDLTTPVTVPY